MAQYASIVGAILLLAIAAAALVIAWRRRKALPSVLAVTTNSRYAAGQVWSLRESPLARLTILRVEALQGAGTIVHVAVSDVPVPVGHMPFTEAAIDRSVAELIRTDAVAADALDGYQVWRKAFETEGAGVFSVTVPEALKVVG